MVSENCTGWGREVPLLLSGNVGGVGVCFNNAVTLEGSVSATISYTDGLVE